MTLIELLENLVKDSSMSTRKKADAKVLLQHLQAINAFGNAVNAQNGEHEHDWRHVDGRYEYQYGGLNSPAIRITPGIRICKICNLTEKDKR